MSIINQKQATDIQTLKAITKAVYVMKADFQDNLYRVGAIRIRDGQINNAFHRLSQCSRGIDNNEFNHWSYLILKQLPNNTDYMDVRALETNLREKTILANGTFNNSRKDRSDRFTTNNENELINIFKQVIC